MINSSDILQLCRLCLVEDKVNHPIFEESDDLRSISLKISSCLPVSIHKDDSLPKKICDTCSTKLDSFYQFWSESANAEKQLLQWVDKNKTSKQQADQSRKMETTEVKKELEDTVDPIDMTSEAQTYILQQQQLPYTSSAPNDSLNTSESEEPAAKRPRRASAVKALQHMGSEDEDDAELAADNYAKTESDDSDKEEEDEDSNYQENPSTTSVEDQPGPSGMSKKKMVLDDTPFFYREDSYPYNLQDEFCYIPELKQDHLNQDLLQTSVDNFSPTDTELLRMLTTEEECTAILQNIAASEQLESLINTNAAFHQQPVEVPIENVQNYPDKKEANFKCEICNRCYTTKKILKKHLGTHTGIKSFVCSVCGKKFRHNCDLTAHEKVHKKPGFQCDICSSMFIHKSHLITHRRKHLGEYVAYCKDCGIGFVRKNLYDNHRRIHHDGEKYICDTCGQSLSTSSGLKEHKATHDENYGKDRQHVCEICGNGYLTSRNLKSHIKIHSRLRKYICNICGKSVSSKKILETHTKMHTGLKDYICNICNSAFASSEYLKVHQRIHSTNKPYICQTCGKSFTQKTSLTVHIRTHTGQKPYKCECGKNFTTKSHLMAHYKTHDVGGVDLEFISNIERLK
ncbi:zinc finger protein 615-like isoform X2 [Coccinella septempunctata]|uniref:zinc finger protein 615-like isoform X2 n=1 Tax=Coccinella septempunctata TaxID=41139 RepID=UPI001D076A38|nr:zinc finger protein 615-like isoform X2 [Coccinella septempunctata]